MKFSKNASFRCSLLYFVAPFILTQITTTYIDSTMITIFFVIIYYMYDIYENNKFKDELMFALCLAIFIGIKGTCMIYGGIFAIAYAIYKIYLIVKKKETIMKLAGKALLFAVIIITIGGYWLIQNIVIYQNPLHPFKFLGIEGMDSYVDIGQSNEPMSIKQMNTVEQVLTSWVGLAFGDTRYDNGYGPQNFVQMHDSRIGAFGIEWMYFLIPISIAAIVFICRKKYKLSKIQIFIISIILICYLVSPGKWWGRYTGFILLIGYIFYGIFEQCINKYQNNKKILKAINIWFSVIFILSIPLSAGYAIFNLAAQKPYPTYDRGFYEFMSFGEPKNTLVLQQEYGEDTQAYVFVKGYYFQNDVDFYYLDEMYPNVKAKNHNVKTYENFEKIANERENTDYLVVFEKDRNKDNSKFAKEYVDEHWKYETLNFGEKIVVYHKLEEVK